MKVKFHKIKLHHVINLVWFQISLSYANSEICNSLFFALEHTAWTQSWRQLNQVAQFLLRAPWSIHLHFRYIQAILIFHLDIDEGNWLALRSARFFPYKKSLGKHWIWSWVGPTASLDSLENKQIYCLHWDSKPRSSSP